MKNMTQLEGLLFGNTRYQRAGWLIPLFVRFVTLGRDDVVELTGISEATAQKYLGDLAALGIIVRQGYRDGYALTAGGKQLVAQQLLASGDQADVTDAVVIEEPSNQESEGINCTFDSMRNEEESIKLINDLNHHQSSEGAKCTFEKMLAATEILFGEAVSSTGLHPRGFEFTLGWIAQAKAQSGSLNSPQGLIYRRLKDGVQQPQKKYFERPLDFLPDEYLDAIGLYHKVCDWCEQEFTDLAQYTEHRPDCIMTQQPERFDEAQAITADETVTTAVEQTWQAVLERLQADMPKASFDTWVRDTTPVHAGTTWQIGVRNAYARDWLESRMSEQVAGALGHPVEFVVSTETEAC